MKKSIFLFGLLILQSMASMAQSKEAIEQGKQKGKLFYSKKMAPKGEDYVNTAPERNTYSLEISAPIDEVWKIVDDTPNFTKWFPGLKSGKMLVEPEKGLGSKRLAHLKSFKYYEEIIAYETNKAWGFTMIESNSGACRSITEVIYLEAIGPNTTKVMYKGGYEFKGIYKMMTGAMNKSIKKIWMNALNGLKEYAEGETKS